MDINIHLWPHAYDGCAPLTLAQIVSGYRYQFEQAESALRTASEDLNNIALGGTAVGTGANAPENFGERVCEQLNQLYDMSLQSHANKFAALSSQDEINRCAQAVNLIAVVLQKWPMIFACWPAARILLLAN